MSRGTQATRTTVEFSMMRIFLHSNIAMSTMAAHTKKIKSKHMSLRVFFSLFKELASFCLSHLDEYEEQHTHTHTQQQHFFSSFSVSLSQISKINKNMNLRRESLSLYRRALRLCNRLPFENVRRKSKYNAREIFDIYRNDKPCEERIRRGT